MIAPEESGKPDGGQAAERLNEDDQAARAAQRFIEGALAKHRRTAWAVLSAPGTCRNCGERCLSTAVYCDDDCRADHERRLARTWKA